MCKRWPGGRCTGHAQGALHTAATYAQEYADAVDAKMDEAQRLGDHDERLEARRWIKQENDRRQATLREKQDEYYATPGGIADLKTWAQANQETAPQEARVALYLASEYQSLRERQNSAHKAGLSRDVSETDRNKINEFIGKAQVNVPGAEKVLAQVTQYSIAKPTVKPTETDKENATVEQSTYKMASPSSDNPRIDPRVELDASSLSPRVKEGMKNAMLSTRTNIGRCHQMATESMTGKMGRYQKIRFAASRRDALRKIEGLREIVNKIPANHGMTEPLRQEWTANIDRIRNDLHGATSFATQGPREPGFYSHNEQNRVNSPFKQIDQTFMTMHRQMGY